MFSTHELIFCMILFQFKYIQLVRNYPAAAGRLDQQQPPNMNMNVRRFLFNNQVKMELVHRNLHI
jgi:hypothetical protein